jgi:beta-galactosidase
MSMKFSRRAFLGDAAMAGVASALNLDPSPGGARLLESLARRSSFDGSWRFTLGDSTGAQAASFDDRHWRALRLPHDWSIEGAFSEAAPAKGNGAYLPTGIGWYRKSFHLFSAGLIQAA